MDSGDAFDRLTVCVDETAEPADIDGALAEFLLGFVETQSTSAGAPTVDRQVTDGGVKEVAGP